MIIVIILAFLVMTIIGIYIANELYEFEEAGYFISAIGFFGFLAALGIGIWLWTECAAFGVLDERIQLYEQENAKIEEQIADIIEQYQEYETGIFKEVSPDKAVTIVSLYPDLKADSLVQSQINIYTSNHNRIIKLKDKQIFASVYRWWAYFGR